MIRFIWQNWWRHKERLILLIVGALILSTGLSVLVGLAQTSNGTVIDQLEKRWHASYDIVVRPPGSRSVTEDQKLLEPDYLSGLAGGITLDQYHAIQDMSDIAVAAPISLIGYINYNVVFDQLKVKKPGLYRVKISTKTETGARTLKESGNYYFPKGWEVFNKGSDYGVGINPNLSAGTLVLLAGIDPKAETKLVGLDDAIVKQGESRYFNAKDTVEKKGNGWQIPILASNQNFVNKTYTFTISRLNLPFDHPDETMEKVKAAGGEQYLDTVDSNEVQQYTYTAEDVHQLAAEGITGVNPETGEPATGTTKIADTLRLVEKPSALSFIPVTSPFSERWPYAYNLKVHVDKTPIFPSLPEETYRPVTVFSDQFKEWPEIHVNWLGFYDSGKLDITEDPLTELPVETYRPASAELVLDAEGNPVNPPAEIKPADKAFGLLTKPPSMLTTLDAAAKILGDKPISAIRIKVAGVTDLNDDSQQVLERVAKQIEDETGLIADITLGSSPQPALTHVPAINGEPSPGWIQQPWVKLGSSIAMFQETKVGLSALIASVMAVAVVYVFASLLVSLLARRKTFAVLLAIGWRPGQLAKLVLLEATLLGTFVALVAWTILGWVLILNPQASTSAFRVLAAGVFGLIIYLAGALIPAWLATRIRPTEALAAGELSRRPRRLFRTRSIVSMAFNHFVGLWRRGLLSIVSIAVPTALLAFFLFITFRLKGVMYTTWLGQYVAVEVGPTQYAAMGLALLIAMLTTAEIMWQNVSERRSELSLLKSIGWQDKHVRALILLEGVCSGFWAGVIGLVFAFAAIWGVYHTFPAAGIGFLLLTGVIPIVTGFLGACLPAERAVRLLPSEGTRSGFQNRKGTEKRFKIVLSTASVVLIIGFLAMMVQVVPQAARQQAASREAEQTETPEVIPTSGMVTAEKEATEGKTTIDHENDLSNSNTLGENSPPITEVIPPGDQYTNYEGWFVIRVDKVFAKPNTEGLKPPGSDMKYVTLRIKAVNTTKQDITKLPKTEPYIPQITYLLSENGKQKPVKMEVIKDSGRHNNELMPEGMTVTDYTFEIKKDKQKIRILTHKFIGVSMEFIEFQVNLSSEK